ncbi:hypothetical protein ACO2Q3_21005 [Caulobacter sp. KR2-114]|uniref:hypothetical protein n=1 Tax=Caulobacter sp. KR2-114 TaxID=3400912 RepID=UPI003C0053C6
MRLSLPDAQGCFSLGLFLLTVLALVLAAAFPDLRHDDLFKTLAQAIVITGLINLAAGFYFGASKAAERRPGPGDPPPPATADPLPESPALQQGHGL